VKDAFATAKQIVMRLPELMANFLKNSIIGFFFEAKSFSDAFIYTKYWAFIWGNIFKFIIRLLFKRGPIVLVRELFFRYP